jgi:two-component system cell cycle sensor histidine kinase/response regulator CckA
MDQPDQKYRVLFEQSSQPTWVCDEQTLIFLDLNNAAVRDYGYSREEFLRMSLLDVQLANGLSELQDEMNGADGAKTVTIHRKKDGTVFTAEVAAKPVLYGRTKAFLVTVNSLAERGRAQRSVVVPNEVLNSFAAFVLVADTDGRITYVTPSFSALGYEPSELLGDGWWNVSRPDKKERESVRLRIARLARREEPPSRTPYEATVRCKDGSSRVLLWQDSAEIPGTVIGVGQDITERKATEEALARSEARLRTLVESNVVGVNFSILGGPILDANDAFLSLLGYSRDDLNSGTLRWDSITPPESKGADEHAIAELRTRGVCSPFEKEYLRKDGVRVPVLLGAAMLPGSEEQCVCIVVDLTERNRLEQDGRALHQELVQSQKMEAIGQLAGGIAHDFNNILNVIGGYTELMLEKVAEEDPLQRGLQRVLEAARRAADLTAQLLAFSRKQLLTRTVLNLNAVIGEILDMLRRLIREDIQLIFSPAANLHLVNADKTRVEQVIINLTLNARDAMPQGGQIKIETRNAEVSPSNRISGLPPGEYACFTVTDNGFGMNEKILSRIFEPFFTTKEVGRGTGLGLSTVYGIMKQSGGEILAESQPGAGSVFSVYLPKTTANLAAEAEPEVSPPEVWGGETILLVEDEDALREAEQDYLESLGYTVLTAMGGEEALEVSARHPGDIALLVTDMVMPGMSGRVVSERLRQSRPEIKTIFVSGYAEELDPAGSNAQRIPFLQKPFLLRMLSKKVQEVLATSEPSAREATG